MDLDDKDDIAVSNRQDIKEGDGRFSALKEFADHSLNKIGNVWGDLRKENSTKKALEIPALQEWYDSLKPDDKKYAQHLFDTIAKFPNDEPDRKRELYKHGIIAFETMKYRGVVSKISEINNDNIELFGSLVGQMDALEAAHYHEIVSGRLEVIKKLDDLASPEVKERTMQEHIFDHLWLLDPSWERASSDNRMEETFEKAFDQKSDTLDEKERKARLDIKYRSAAGKHIIIELKRFNRSIDINDLMKQVDNYCKIVRNVLKSSQDNQPFEIICLLGSPPTGPEENVIRDRLASANARYLTYDRLIKDARMSYADYLQKHANLTVIRKVIDSL